MPRFLPFAAVLLLAAARPLAAQRADTVTLAPMVISVTKVPVTAGTTSTASTTVVGGEELRAKGAVSLVDALRAIPGISLGQTSGPGSQTSLFLRGGNSNFTKVLVDGVPLNAPGGAIDLAGLTTDDVDRIEIVRGPASALYGSDAMTGVVQIFTKSGGPSTLAARGGNRDGRYDASASLAGDRKLGAARSIHGSLNGGYHRSSGFLPFNNQSRDAIASAAGRIQGTRGIAALSASWGDARYHYPTNGAGEPVDSNAWTGANRLSFSANGLWSPIAHVTARAQLGHATRLSRSSDLPDSPGDTGMFAYFSRGHGRTVRDIADVQVARYLPGGGTMTVGGSIEGQHARARNWNSYAGDTTIAASRTNRAVYAQLVAAIPPGPSPIVPLTADLGARHEVLTSGRAVTTGRAGLAVGVTEWATFRGSIGTAFKEPALEELYGDGFSMGEPSLRPERNHSREVGAESRLLGGVLMLGATAFWQRFTDLVQYRYIDAGTSNYYNVLAARARGLELESRLAPGTHLTTRASYTIVHTEVTDPGNGGFGAVEQGKALLRRPRRTGALDATWGGRRGSLSATLTRVGARDDYDFGAGTRRRLEPYTLLDASVELPFAGAPGRAPTLALTLRGENLGDSRYQNVYGFATPGRIVFVGVRARGN